MFIGAFLGVQWLYYTTSCPKAVWILIQYKQKMHVFHSTYLNAFPPIGWNVGCAFIFIQVGNMYVHEMWEVSVVITEILAWEQIQLQRNKNRFSVHLGSCQNMSTDMLKNPSPIFSDIQDFESSSDYLWNSLPIPRESCREQKG